MNSYLIPLFSLWVAMAAAVLALALYRKLVATQEDDLLHLADGESHQLAQQVVVGHKLLMIDRWGKVLTIVATSYGLALGTLFLYVSWVNNNAASANVPLLH